MMGADTALTLLVLLALSSVAAFAPSFTRGLSIRHMRALAPRAKNCAPERARLGPCVVSPLYGTGASYTEIVAETDDDDDEDNEEGGSKQREGDGDGEIEGEVNKTKKQKKKSGVDKQKVKLEPEVTFFEGGPDVSEVVAPAISILTVIGIVPFTAALARQAWVKYTITSRRIKIVSGWQGKDTTEVVYPDIVDMRFVWRSFGRCGDLVMTLRDGSKLEVRSLPEFERNYNYILERTPPILSASVLDVRVVVEKIEQDFLDGMTTVPSEIRRNSQLMRTLDKDAHSLSTELEALHNKFLSQAREKMKARGDSQDMDPKALVDDPPLMSEIGSLFSRTKQIVDEKVAIAEQTHQMVADRLKRLTTDLATFEQALHNQGEFDVGAAQPGDQVAFQEDAESEWVLGRVLSWMHDTGQYQVMDEDDNNKKLLLDEHQVIPLEGRSERLAKGDEVLAVYVDTTSFYHATIAIPPRGRGANIGNGGQAHVQFVDDADENGITPQRLVPTIHIIKLPFGS